MGRFPPGCKGLEEERLQGAFPSSQEAARELLRYVLGQAGDKRPRSAYSVPSAVQACPHRAHSLLNLTPLLKDMQLEVTLDDRVGKAESGGQEEACRPAGQ